MLIMKKIPTDIDYAKALDYFIRHAGNYFKAHRLHAAVVLGVGEGDLVADWETTALSRATQALERSAGRSDKERAADFVFTAFETIRQLGIERFLREDLPALRDAFPEEAARRHCMNSAANLFARLQQAHIRFTTPDATVRSVIQLMYLSILNSAEIGDSFFPALRELVASACDRLVA